LKNEFHAFAWWGFKTEGGFDDEKIFVLSILFSNLLPGKEAGIN
jgi:hypothetical protein